MGSTGVFITGTDTDIGKTAITLGLMAALQRRGLTVLGMKPVASGCVRDRGGLRSADALSIIAQAGVIVDEPAGTPGDQYKVAEASAPIPYDIINPYAFEPPMAPHIAAGRAGVDIEIEPIRVAYQSLAARADVVLVEGVGGWRVPLGPSLAVSDLPSALGLPVILVIGMKLGCLSHSLLTAESIRAGGNRLVGWISTRLDPDMLAPDENLATLAALLHAPCLGVVPWLDDPAPEAIAAHLILDALFADSAQTKA
jgi:dethiobiotin synthetase